MTTMLSPIYTKALADATANAAKYPDHPGMAYGWVGVADTAKLIRATLKKSFPGIKFYVRSESYSGGASIDVYYDGVARDALWTQVNYLDDPYGDPVSYSLVDYSVGQWAPVTNPGMPKSKDVDAVLGAFKGGRFDGMIDMAYSVDSWLLPDGSATLGHNPGSAGSGGYDTGYDIPAPAGAVRVHFGATHVFVNNRLPYGV